MKRSSLYFLLVLCCLGVAGPALAGDNEARGPVRLRDIVVPAGTLLSCTLSEPKFSSATVSVGDPFLCHPRSMQELNMMK